MRPGLHLGNFFGPTSFKSVRESGQDSHASGEAVWGYESGIGSDRTVDVHIRHLRQKIEDDPAQPRWIVTVRGVGYKLDPEGLGL